MKACQRTLLILLVLVLGIGIGVGVTTTLPKVSSQWAYAVEKNESAESFEKLQGADDLSVAFGGGEACGAYRSLIVLYLSHGISPFR